MKAIHLDRAQLYLTSVMKTPAPEGRSWPRKDIARMLPAFFQELRLAACSTVLLMGEACAQAVLYWETALSFVAGLPAFPAYFFVTLELFKQLQ